MTIVNEIQDAMKSDKIVIGYRESIKFVKTSSPRIVVIAKNSPDKVRKEMENSIKNKKTKIEIFGGSSKDLGVACGKPFPISVLVIKD